jgi:hypothetical protein
MDVLVDFLKVMSFKALILAVVYMLVLVLIFLDLWSGVRKAKQKNMYISSYGFRKTISKIARYFNVLFAVTIIDVMQMLAIFEIKQGGAMPFIPVLPIFTFLAAIFIGVIEIKSIYEKSDQKEKAKAAETAKIIGETLKNNDTKDVIINILNTIKTSEKN